VSPFETWSYRPPYLRTGTEIKVARGTFPTEPMLFATPFGGRPAGSPPERREPIEHAIGVREISQVRVTLAESGEVTGPLQVAEQIGVATFARGSEHLMELSFDGAVRGESADFRPALPLVLHW
jgi:hypothetical protein